MRIVYFLLSLWISIHLTSTAIAKPSSHRTSLFPPSKRTNTSVIYGSNRLKQTLDTILSNSDPDAEIAVYVKSMQFGDGLYAHNVSRSLSPASTLKVLTAEAALLFLGSEYRFSTQLLADSKIVKHGILQGNLYIVLSGDPTLTYFDLEDLFLTLKALQIYAISGNVYIDHSAYDQRFYGPGWDAKDKESCYGAPISASIINHNCLAYKGTPVKIKRVTTNKRCRVHITKKNNRTITINKCIRTPILTNGYSYVVTDVSEYNRTLFKNLLKRLGVNVYGKITLGAAPDKLAFLAHHTSEPLKVLIKAMLKKSDNIIAGAVFKKIGQLYSHQPGSWENGSLAVSNILAKKAGLHTAGLRILDGSGLSPENLLTSMQMMQVLDFAYHHPSKNDFIAAFPISGIDGTLKFRLTHVARKVRAKTGTISGVISLAGYATTRDKEELAFVIMVNGKKEFAWRYREMEDEIATALTRYKR